MTLHSIQSAVLYINCETLEIYNLNMQMRKPSCKRKTESGNILMSNGKPRFEIIDK